MFRRFAAVILSAILLSPGWLGMTGMTLLIGFVPLLWVSASYDDTRRSWWGMFGWATLAFVLWNALTIWWIWYATPVGPPAATLASTTMNMIAFMLFHTVSKKAPKALAYVTLVTAWITTEYWYTVGDFSWPWLILGNGFSHEVWAVQWYEYMGVFGGTLWVLLSNILIFEALQASRSTRRWAAAACSVALPMIASLCIWQSWEQPDEGTARVSVIQPNVDCYDKFHGDTQRQERNIADLMAEVPAGAQFILLPETAVPGDYLEPGLSDFYSAGEPGAFWQELTDSLRSRHPEALLITGAGDDLQGIKRGIMELADILVVTKDDGDNRQRAAAHCQELKMVLHYLQSPTPGWTPSVLTCSSLEGRGLDTIEETLFRFRDSMKESGFWYSRRRSQSLSWVQSLVHEALLTAFEQHPAVASRMPILENMVAGDKMDPVSAAHDLLSHFTYPAPGH